MQKYFVIFTAALALVAAESLLVEDEEGRQFYLAPVASRERRQADGPKLFGQGGGNGQSQGGFVKLQNPNGSGGSLGYGHANGFGHVVSADAMVPVWSKKSRFGESTFNVGGGATQKFGGYGGNMNLDKRVGVNFNHRW
ncbi:uncharacterized protein LOC132701145 [Cylas formicarius]|uniref:uncharacterized protein LOC132701145 n=1 Tax=Cylas formicarius TaxID=197179 RepID=UPI0029588360|nr:uncharacterized protein LOC132701145 [Cylas formicarius]